MVGIFTIRSRSQKGYELEKALEVTCKYENVSDDGANLDVEQLELQKWMHISKLICSTERATSENKIDFMRKEFSIEEVSSLPFCLENCKNQILIRHLAYSLLMLEN